MLSFTTKRLVDHTPSELLYLTNRAYPSGAMAQEIRLQLRLPNQERRKGTIHYFKDNEIDVGWIFHRLHENQWHDVFFWVDNQYRNKGIGISMFLLISGFLLVNHISNIKVYAHNSIARTFFDKLKANHPEIDFDIVLESKLIVSCVNLPNEEYSCNL